MDPITAIGTISGLILGVAKIANSVSNIKERWKYAPLNISMVLSSLWAIKAALENIAEWRSSTTDDSEQSVKLDNNLEVCIESCAVMVAVVENRLKDIDVENISKYDKLKFMNLDTLFKDFASNLRAQVEALQLLLTIYQCRSLSEQNKQLQQTRTRNVVRAVRQSTAGLPYEDKDIEDAASILSETPSTAFTFDKIIMQHQRYASTYPKLYQRMQTKFPSRSNSVASTVMQSTIKPKRQPVQALDPLIDRNISLPFLGVPFHGEAEHNLIEEYTTESDFTHAVKGKKDATRDESGARVLPDEGVSQVSHKPITKNEQLHDSVTAGTASRAHTMASPSGFEMIQPADSKEDTAKRHTIVEAGTPAQETAKRSRKSFDSMYDVSDEEVPGNQSVRASPVHSGADSTVQPQSDTDRLQSLPSPNSATTTIDASAPADTSTKHVESLRLLNANDQSFQTGEIQQSSHDDVAPSGTTSDIPSTDINASSKSLQGKTPAIGQFIPPVSNATDETKTFPTKNVSTAFLDINFGPDLDLNILPQHTDEDFLPKDIDQVSMIDHEYSEEAEITHPAATSSHIADEQSVPSSDTDHIAMDHHERSYERSENAAAEIPDTEAIDVSEEVVVVTIDPPVDNYSVPGTNPQQIEPYPEAPAKPPPQPPRMDTSVSSEEVIPQITPPVSRVASDLIEATKSSQADSIISDRSQTLVQQMPSESEYSDRTPTTTTFYPVTQTSKDVDSRTSFQSDNSRYFHAPASPISVQSQHAPSSMTSADDASSYNTRDHFVYNSPATSMTGPAMLSPKLNLDPSHEKKRLALTKSLAKFTQKTTPSTSRLSILPGIFNLKGSTEKATKARELAQAVQSGDPVHLSTLVQHYDKSSEISALTAIEEETIPKTALMRACSSNNIDCAQVLLSYDPTCAACVDKQGKTALHYAFENDSYDAAYWLLSQLSDVYNVNSRYKSKDGQNMYEMSDNQGITPIQLAAQTQSQSFLEILHKANANLSIKSSRNWSILHFAVSAKSFDNVQYIVRQGLADVNEKDSAGKTPLMLAAVAGDSPSLSFLLENGANKDILDNAGNTALHHAASNGNITAIETLFQSMEDVTAKNSIGEQPLHLAAAGNHTEVLTALLRIPGVHPNVWTKPPHMKHPVNRLQGTSPTAHMASTPLHYACSSGQHDAADILINRGGAIVNANQEDGYSPLMMACQAKSSATVSLLLLHGADPRASTEKEGLTALHVACKVNDLASTRLLIEYGADVLATMRNKNKDTASMLAFRENNEEGKGAAYYTMRYRARVLQANQGQFPAANGVIQSGANNPPGTVVYAPNVRNVQYGVPLIPSQYSTHYPVQSQYPIQSQHPIINAAPFRATGGDEPPPPPYQR